jgi:hypothetical protein
VVDSASGTATGPFTITLAYEALPAGDVCTNAERISAGSQSGTVVGYANDYGSGTMCAGTAGADHVYVVSVGAGQTLTAAVTTGGSGFDPSISLQTSCGDATRVCVAGDDSGGAATVNMVTHTNSGAAAEDEYIVIDTFSSTTTGTYTLDVMLTP